MSSINTKLTIEYLVVAENVIRDITGKISIIGIFTGIFGVPTIISFFVVGRLINVPQKAFLLALRVYKPDGSILKEVKLSGPIVKNGRLNMIAKFSGVEIKESGKYIVKLFVDDTEFKLNTDLYFEATKGKEITE